MGFSALALYPRVGLDVLRMQEAESVRVPRTQDSKRQHSSQASFMQYEMFLTSIINFPICPLPKRPSTYPSASDQLFSESSLL